MTTTDTATVSGEDGSVRLDRWFKLHHPARDDAAIVLNKPPGVGVQGGSGTERLDGSIPPRTQTSMIEGEAERAVCVEARIPLPATRIFLGYQP